MNKKKIEKSKSNYPICRHSYCEDQNCKICFDDSMKLADFLYDQLEDNRQDFLGEYRWWLDKVEKFEGAETEYGWFHPDVFSKELIDGFIDYWINRGK